MTISPLACSSQMTESWMLGAIDGSNFVLEPFVLHVWHAHLDQFISDLPMFWEMLSDSEQSRANRFKFLEHRQRFIIGRGILRLLLSRYAKQLPKALQFQCNAQGKPFLVQTPDSRIQFNRSDSLDHALYVFTVEQAVGIDIENIHRVDAMEPLAERFFAVDEYQALMDLPENQRRDAFFAVWTRKEAFVKALGLGLSFPLDQFSVSLDKSHAQITRIADHSSSPSQWFLSALDPHPDFAAAVAVHGRVDSIERRKITERLFSF